MSLKSWVLDRVQRMNGLAGRGDLPRACTSSNRPRRAALTARHAPHGAAGAPRADATLSSAEHLGAYAPLIAAIRDELEHFVASQVRLHLAIADRDRFLLTSIGVRCPAPPTRATLLQQFMHEFKPEQVKRYLAREVIGGLPNAAAIDLSQFAGLFDADARDDRRAAEAGNIASCWQRCAARRFDGAAPLPGERPRPLDRARPARAAAPRRRTRGATPSTPLAGQRCEFDIEDGDGRRRVVLQAVVPGRRYVIGKGEGCDIRVNGTYASRRHAEIWLDNGAWWVTDAGSTNGMRVESPAGAPRAAGATAPATSASADQARRRRAHRAVGARRGTGERVPVAGDAAAGQAAARMSRRSPRRRHHRRPR